MYTCLLCFGYLIDYQGIIYRLYAYPEEKLVMVVIVGLFDLQLSVQAVHITTKVVSSNPAHGKVVLIYEIMMMSPGQNISYVANVLARGHHDHDLIRM
jgi:hypothetical protein